MAEVDKEAMEKKFPSNDYTKIKPREEIARKNDKPEKSKLKGKVREPENKKTFGERIADNFMNIDYEQIKDRLLFDWLFPEIISTLGDILRMIFSQDGRGRSRSSARKRRDGYTEYSSISDGSSSRNRRDPTRQDFRKIRLEFYEREDAEEVLDDLRERLEGSSVDFIPVRDLYSLADLPTNSTMLNWVWYDLEDCHIERNGDNYVLRMPPAEQRRR